MTDYLTGHFRYSTLHGWNRSTSFAHCMKIGRLGFPAETENRLYDLIGCEGAYDTVNGLITEFGEAHSWKWQAGFNGRSGGYLVLYSGGRRDSGYRSFCASCGQQNYKSVRETGTVCRRCGSNAQRDYGTPPMETFVYPVRSVGQDGDYADWTMDELRKMTRVVQDFDALADAIAAEALYLAENYAAAEEIRYVPETAMVLSAA